MANRKVSSSRAFFLELVLDLVIFAICAAICLQVFAEARIESARSDALSKLGIEAQAVCEQFKAGNNEANQLASSTNADQDDNTLHWYYDKELNATSKEKAYFVMTCIIDDTQPVKEAKVSLNEVMLDEGSQQLFEFSVSCYHRGGGGS